MARLKFGFHTGSTGYGVDRNFYTTLDAANIPCFAKGSDNLPYDLQEIARNSAVPHVIIYRRSIPPAGQNWNPDVPDYNKSPHDAAVEHWNRHKNNFPPNLDPNITWVETINELDKNRAEWIAEFAIETAYLTMADGYKWLAFGWSTGEPEPHHWTGPKMRQFLNLVAQHPDKLGIALHEYSLDPSDIQNGIGYLIGRFQFLLDVNPNVNIYITEWGWAYNDAPSYTQAMVDIMTIAPLYNIPQVKGAAIWCLNGGWGNLHNIVRTYVEPLRQLTLNTVLLDPPPPLPQLDYTSIPVLMPQNATLEEMERVQTQVFPNRRTVTQSHDEAIALVQNARPTSYIIIYGLERWPVENQNQLLAVAHELRDL